MDRQDRIIHLCNGAATARGIGLAELPGEVVVWADALDLGPVLPIADADHYKRRGEFWAAAGLGNAADHAQQLADWDRALDAAANADELILWFEHDLFDQLALVRTLARLSRRGYRAQLSIVSIDRHPDVPAFVGFGQLSPAQLAELWPRRAPLSRDSIDEAITAWIAVTAADPRALPLLARRVRALPYLAGALERHLEEYPDPLSGLSRTERQVLAAIARGEASETAIVAASHASDPRYPLTDVVLRAALRGLAAAGLVEANGTAITTRGRQALAGALDRVHDIGIDTWRGGVHLTGKGPVWRWDSRERRLIEK